MALNLVKLAMTISHHCHVWFGPENLTEVRGKEDRRDRQTHIQKSRNGVGGVIHFERDVPPPPSATWKLIMSVLDI